VRSSSFLELLLDSCFKKVYPCISTHLRRFFITLTFALKQMLKNMAKQHQLPTIKPSFLRSAPVMHAIIRNPHLNPSQAPRIRMHVIKTCYHWSTKTNKSPDCSRISHISSHLIFIFICILVHPDRVAFFALSNKRVLLPYSQHIQYSLFFKQRLTAHRDKSTLKFQIPERKP
jgi:hypothetical protein